MRCSMKSICPLLAIPVFNEEQSLTRVLDSARAYCRDILVIDDGSTDRTSELLRGESRIAVITHAENRGYGRSLADAFAHARRHYYSCLITMDCDEQHYPPYIPAFIAAAEEGDADVISGTRYPDGRYEAAAAPADRRAINREITAVLARRLGLHLSDAFCGFKAYRVSALRDVRVTVSGYAMPIEFWVQAARHGLRIRELPVRLIYNDPNRHFGGMLDDPDIRLAHYLEVLEGALAADVPAEVAATTLQTWFEGDPVRSCPRPILGPQIPQRCWIS